LSFAAVATRHPYRLDRLIVRPGNQVTLCTIDGAKSLHNSWPFDGITRLCHFLAKGSWEGKNLVQGANPLPEHGLDQLAGPVRGLPELHHYFRKLLTGKA